MAGSIQLPHDHCNARSRQQILQSLPTEETVLAVSQALNQLGDPSRLRIFWLLCHTEECVADIAAYMQMSSPAVSHHLKLLKAAGMLASRREGREMLYRAADTTLVRELHVIIERIGDISCPG